MDLRILLHDELARRRARNPRYSMRAFARSMSLHHTAISRILRGNRGLSREMLDRLTTRLGLSPAEARDARAVENARRVLLLASSPAFRPDCRWIAMQVGIELDDVNRALHRLLHEGRLVMHSPATWTVRT